MKSEPDRDCPLCPRLVAFRKRAQAERPDAFNGAVPSFGDRDGRLLIVGLAPGLNGANRTGRPFTGDYAGDLLYATLIELGLAKGRYEARPDDGLVLKDCLISNAVRCVPPENKPTPEEITRCRPFLAAVMAEMPRLKAIVALGRIAHESVLRATGTKLSAFAFAHAAQHSLQRWTLIDSYHCSRYNTNTGRLTADMFRNAMTLARDAAQRR